MFARWSHLAFRRCLHTGAPRVTHQSPYNRLALVLGLSAATATYMTWHLSSDTNRIALDSAHGEPRHPSSIVQPNSLSANPAGKLSKPTKSTKSDPEPDLQPSSAVTPSSEPQSTEEKDAAPQDGEDASTSGGGGAYNPETGEINWDCPCLGGMAHGPCGLQFREAFSCFVFSEVEPKGMDCVEKFKAMQDCFREHPDVYADGMYSLPFPCLSNLAASEIMDDDEPEGPSAAGEQSSAVTTVAEDTKGETPTAPPPPKPSPDDTTPASTPSS